MTLVRATITNTSGVPVATLTLRVEVLRSTGEPRPLAEGKAEKGDFTLEIDLAFAGEIQPRIRLVAVLPQPTGAVLVVDTPERFDRGVVDFGTVLFTGRPLGKLGDVEYYGINKSVWASVQAIANTSATEEIATLRANLDVKERDLAAARKLAADAQHQLDELSAAVPIADVLTSIGEQRDAADVALRSRGVQIGNFSIDMKLLAPSTGKVKFLGSDDLVRFSGQASTLGFALHRTSPASASSADVLVTPDVRGYTQGLAQRKLAASGLRADVSFELAPTPADVGRVVTQVPGAGAPAQQGAAVTIFVGKPVS